jgi:hypothetical protein
VQQILGSVVRTKTIHDFDRVMQAMAQVRQAFPT